ncbi:hypothetical protein PAAG_03600 [Paracoccidioides lutzii Pb01]|uniref:Uncharacterized protein n=1 Tax=Paracoccidioides lutzii (strain ATCC MYA-826 / Pb01) TaxID=502779 RepID=C1GXM6_PARBA|nr:hypothetical protein PAAG_03600 [Paracoccidioides lutzii Pb01]EEH41314.2 hypothetical protein PAAG_03600 [Paracoccidioides lutzii Pb01]
MVFLRSLSRHLCSPASSLFAGRSRGASGIPRAASASPQLYNVSSLLPRLLPLSGVRTLTASPKLQGKVLLVLYDGGEHAKQQPGLLGTTEERAGACASG